MTYAYSWPTLWSQLQSQFLDFQLMISLLLGSSVLKLPASYEILSTLSLVFYEALFTHYRPLSESHTYPSLPP